MAMMYQNAVLAISADASDNDHQGIFKGAKNLRNKSDSFVLLCHSSKRGVAGQLYVDRRNVKPKNHPEVMPLQTRAWVLQEKVLSVRKLRYRGGGLSWECQMMASNEMTPWIHQRNLISKELHNIPFSTLPSRLDFDDPDTCDGDTGSLAWWYLQVNDYMKRQLTFKKDRFPAIAGLATEFSRRTGYHYAAGIWIEDFQRGLLWKGAGSRGYSAFSPSWSWASADFYEWAGPPYATDSFLKHGNENGAELIEIPTSPGTKNFLAPQMPMVLTLRGWFKDISSLRAAGQFYAPGPHSLAFGVLPPPSRNQSNVETVVFWLDFPIDAGDAQRSLEDRRAVVMRVADFETWPSSTNLHLVTSSTWALLLEPTKAQDRTYRRVGLVKIPSLNPLADIKGFDQRTILIV